MATTDTLQLQGPLSAVLPVRHSTGLGRARQWQPQRQSRRTRAGCDRNSFVSEHKASSGTAELQRQAEEEKLLCSPGEPARYKRGDCLQHGAGSHRISAPCQRPPIAYEKLKDAKINAGLIADPEALYQRAKKPSRQGCAMPGQPPPAPPPVRHPRRHVVRSAATEAAARRRRSTASSRRTRGRPKDGHYPRFGAARRLYRPWL